MPPDAQEVAAFKRAFRKWTKTFEHRAGQVRDALANEAARDGSSDRDEARAASRRFGLVAGNVVALLDQVKDLPGFDEYRSLATEIAAEAETAASQHRQAIDRSDDDLTKAALTRMLTAARALESLRQELRRRANQAPTLDEILADVDAAERILAEVIVSIDAAQQQATRQQQENDNVRAGWPGTPPDIIAGDLEQLDRLVSQTTTLERAIRPICATLGEELVRVRRSATTMAEKDPAAPLMALLADDAATALRAAHRLQGKAAIAERLVAKAARGVVFMSGIRQAMSALPGRVRAVNDEALASVSQRAALLDGVDLLGAADPGQISIIKQLVLVTSLSPTKITSEFGKATTPAKVKKLIETLRKKTKGSEELRTVIAQSHQLIEDCYRLFGRLAPVRTLLTTVDPALTEKFKTMSKLAEKEMTHGMVALATSLMNKPAIDDAGVSDDDLSVEYVLDPQQLTRTVAVMGGGPVGLLAAIEAAMRGSRPTIYEARGGASGKTLYNRLNIVKLDADSIQRLRKVGVYDQIKGMWDDGQKAIPVGDLEKTLADTARSFGVGMVEGAAVQDVRKNSDGRVTLDFGGRPPDVTVDRLIVTTGARFARAGDSVSQAEQLGFTVSKVEATDFAATGFSAPDATGTSTPGQSPEEGWEYFFKAKNVEYALGQITEEQFRTFSADPDKLRAYVAEMLQRRGGTGGDAGAAPMVFPIELQKLDSVASDATLVAGDAAGTPHPNTSLGLNTGIREIAAMSPILGTDITGKDPDEELAAYDWEATRLIEQMVAKGVRDMAGIAMLRVKQGFVKPLRTKLDADHAMDPATPQVRADLDTINTMVTEARAQAVSSSNGIEVDDGTNAYEKSSNVITVIRACETRLERARTKLIDEGRGPADIAADVTGAIESLYAVV